MSDEERNDALFEAAKRLFDVFVQASGDRFQCVLDQRCFSTQAIATAHLYKSHAENLRELMPEEGAASGVDAVQESGVVDMEESSQPQAVWSQEQADELVALQMALDEYSAQQQQTQPVVQQQHHEASRDQLHRRSSGSTPSSNSRQTPQLERTPSSATKRGRAGKQSMSKQERLLSLLSKTDDILQTVQRAVEQEQARQQVASSSTSTSASGSSSASSIVQPQQPLLLTGGALYDFQLRGVSWLSSLHASGLNGILADEMGLGKTVQVIGFLAALAERFQIIGPHLITVPLGVLRTWTEAFEKWCPAASVMVFHGTKEERYTRFRDFAHSLNEDEITSPCVVLTTYEMALKDFATLQRIPRRWAYLVVDEAHRLKNWNSKLVQVLRALQPRRRLLLTGTPLQNNLSELWSLLNFLLPSIFDDVFNFLEWFNAPFNLEASASSTDVTLSDEERSVVIERLHAVLRPFLLRRVKADVLQSLPSKVERVVRCPLSPLQVALYKKIRDRVSLQQSISYMNVMMQLRKLCNHPFLVLDQEAISDDLWARHLIKASGKLAVLSQLLNVLLAGRHKVLIFSQMVVMLDILEDFLAQAGIGHQRIDGQCSAVDRSDRMRLFNDDDEFRFPVFLISTRAGGVGLNLQAADTVIIFDSDWNPQMDLQAQDRAHRLGQTNDVLVLRLISTGPETDMASVEEVLLGRAKHKLDTEALVLQSGQFAGKPNVSYSELFETKAESAAAASDDDSTAIAITSVDDCAAQIAAATCRVKETHSSEVISPLSSLPNSDRELLVMTEEELQQDWDSHLQEAKETGSDDAPTGRRKRLVVNYNEDARWNELLQQQQQEQPEQQEQQEQPEQQQERRRLPTAAGAAERAQSAEASLADESLTTAEDESQAASRYSFEPAHSPTGLEEPPAVCAMCGQSEVDEVDGFDESAPFKQAPNEDWGANPLNLPQEYDFDLVEHVSHEEQRVKVRRSVLLLCDGCNSAFHLECVGLAVVPPGDWFCEWCVHQMQRS